MRTPLANTQEHIDANPLYAAKDVLDLQKMRTIKPIDPDAHILKTKLSQTKKDLEVKLKQNLTTKRDAPAQDLTDEMILHLDKCCYNDFDLLENIQTPKCCSNLNTIG